MKKLFVLTAALVFSFAVMTHVSAQTPVPAKPDTEKTCADWRAEGKCPRATESTPCADLRAAGRCPRANATAAAQPRTGCGNSHASCGGCSSSKQAEKVEATPTKETATTRKTRRERNRRRS